MLLGEESIILMATPSLHKMISFRICTAQKESSRLHHQLFTWDDATQLVLRVSWPLARLLQEMTRGSGVMVRRTEQGGEEQSITREVDAKLREIAGVK